MSGAEDDIVAIAKGGVAGGRVERGVEWLESINLRRFN